MIVKDNGKTVVRKNIEISLEAIKIARDYPELTVEECLEKAKEIYSYDKNWKTESDYR